MKKLISYTSALLVLVATMAAHAETQTRTGTTYMVSVQNGNVIETPAGKTNLGYISHGSSVGDDGIQGSVWCTGQTPLNDEGNPMMDVGYCTTYFDDGSRAFHSYIRDGDGPTTMTYLGGTGRYKGITGSGTVEFVSGRGDGRAWTTRYTITSSTP